MTAAGGVTTSCSCCPTAIAIGVAVLMKKPPVVSKLVIVTAWPATFSMVRVAASVTPPHSARICRLAA